MERGCYVSSGAVLLVAIFVIALIDWVRARLRSGGRPNPQRVTVVAPPPTPFLRRLRRQGREAIVGGGIIAFVVIVIAHSSRSHH
jgi:hypothetical protein